MKSELEKDFTKVIAEYLHCFSGPFPGMTDITDFDAARQRYQNDPVFHARVSTIVRKLIEVVKCSEQQ